MRSHVFVFLAAACTPSAGDKSAETDTGVVETDDSTGDSGDSSGDSGDSAGDTGDTGDSGDSGDSGLNTNKDCAPSTFVKGTASPTPPVKDEVVDVTYRLELCTTPSGIEGVWRATYLNQANEYHCWGEVPFTATMAANDCDDCDIAYTDVVYAPGTYSDADLCTFFGTGPEDLANPDFESWEDILTSGYGAIGVSTVPVVYRKDGNQDWVPFPETPGAAAPTRTTVQSEQYVTAELKDSYALPNAY